MSPLPCGPAPGSRIAVWCPTCGTLPDSTGENVRPRRRCLTGGCRGHLVSLRLHPMPPAPPRVSPGYLMLALVVVFAFGGVVGWVIP